MKFLKSKIVLIVFLFILLSSIVSKAYIGIFIIPMVLLFHYLIPGVALQKYFCYLNYNDFNKIFFSSIAVGYAFAIFVYIILLICGGQKYTLLCSIIISAISTLYIYKDLPYLLKQQENNTAFLSVVLFLCLGMGFIGFQCQHLSADIVGGQDMHCDLVYWYRNAVASTISYPLPDLSVMGKDLFYHYFTSIAIADLSLITGIDLFDLCFSFSYLIRMILVVGSAYLLSSEYIRRKVLLYVTILLILFGTSIENLTWTNYVDHIYFNGIGLAEGLAMCLFSYYFFRNMCNYTVKGVLLPVLVFMIAVGLKAPCALVVLGGVLFSCLIHSSLYEKDKYKKWCSIAFLYLASFVLIMLLFVYNINPTFVGEGNGSLTPSIVTAFRPPFFNSLYLKFLEIIPIPIIPLIIVFVLYFIINNCLLLCGGILVFRRRKLIKWKSTDLSLLAMYLGGNSLFLFFDHSGFSNVFFCFVAMPFGMLFLLSIFEIYNFHVFNKFEVGLINSGLLIALFFFIHSVMFQIDVPKLSKLIRSNNDSMVITGNSISTDELMALRWAKENIDKNAILISNKIFAEDGSRSYVISSYTERQTYLEGYLYSASSKDKTVAHRLNLLKLFFQNDFSAHNQLQKEGVTHVVLFKNIPKALPNVRGINIFENSSVVIYQI